MMVHIIAVLQRAFTTKRLPSGFYLVLLAALARGALWFYAPFLVEQRLEPPPFGQPGAILFLVLGASCFWRATFDISIQGLALRAGCQKAFIGQSARDDTLADRVPRLKQWQ